jgi:peptidylprolyl isomerase
VNGDVHEPYGAIVLEPESVTARGCHALCCGRKPLGTLSGMRRVIGVVALAATMVFGVAACGSSSDKSAAGTQPTSTAGACAVAVGTDISVKPTITVPNCAQKPSGLVTQDIVAGSGPAAKAGDAVTVKYVGVSWSTKAQFDASWDNGHGQYTVQPLGQAAVIQGWNEGLVGVKKGGRRLLVIPPALGYGAQANGPIAANETLIFVVDVVSIN